MAEEKCTKSPLCFAAYHMPNQLFTFHFHVPDHEFYQYTIFTMYPHGCLTAKKNERERDGTKSARDLVILQFIIIVGFSFV